MRKRESRFGVCHPALTFAFFMASIALTVVVQHPAYVAISVLGGASLLLTLRGRRALGTIAWMVPLFVVLSAINPLFSTGGRHILFYLFGRPYTWESLCYGMVIAGMLVATLLWFSCYSDVMTSDKFTCLFGSVIPSLSLLLVMILRLIPSYQRKAKQIAASRRCIGHSFGGSLKSKAAEGTAMLSALTSWALEGAIITADSMRCRGYGTAKRTNYQFYRWRSADITVAAVMALLLSGSVAGIVLGWTQAKFIPVPAIAPLNSTSLWGLLAYTVFLLLPTFLNVLEEIKWTYLLSKI